MYNKEQYYFKTRHGLFFKKYIFFLLGLGLITALANAQSPKIHGKPNILFIQCDQFRYDCQGKNNPMVKTPNIDQLTPFSYYS